MSGWFSTAEMTELGSFAAELGLTSSIVVSRRGVVVDTDPSQVYGNDSEAFTDQPAILGWLLEEPAAVIDTVAGAMAVVYRYRLYLPLGTVVASGDRIKTSAYTYVVEGTNADSTWLTLLKLTLRRLE